MSDAKKSATPSVITPAPTSRDPGTAAQIAASTADFAEAVHTQIAWLVDFNAETDQPMTVAHANEQTRRLNTRSTHPEKGADQVSWLELAVAIEHEPERAQTTWQSILEAARLELSTGIRSSRAVEGPNATPYDRARFLVIVEALTNDLQPRGASEQLLVHAAATAYERHLHWVEVATKRECEEVWQGEADKRRAFENMTRREQEQYQDMHGWIPPRVSAHEAIDQANQMADRYMRSYLRTIKTIRDNRRLLGNVLVNSGGQLNVAERQMVNPATKEN